MRKFLMFLIVIALGFGAFAAWWVLFWVNPQDVVSQSFVNLAKAKTVKSFSMSVYWDVLHPSGQGFVFQKWLSYAGSLDVSDPTAPKAGGVIGYSTDPSGADFQTADAVLVSDRVYVRLRDDASEEIKGWFKEAGVATGTSADATNASWYSFTRTPLLKKAGLGSWLAEGKGADVRMALLSAGVGTWAVAGSAKMYDVGRRRTMDVVLHPSADTVNAGLIGLIHAWHKRSPSGPEFDWALRSAAEAARGNWTATIDIQSRTIRELSGTWPLLSESGDIDGHVTVRLTFDGIGLPVTVMEPTPFLDLTSSIVEKGPTTFSPSNIRPPLPPPVEVPTSTDSYGR